MSANLTDVLRQAVGDMTNYDLAATVLSVDKNANTCDVRPVNGSGDYVDVALSADPALGFVTYPVVGSNVVISLLDPANAYVSQFGAIESYAFENGGESLFAILDELVQGILDIKLQTGYGPTTALLTAPTFTALKNRLGNLFTR